MASAGVTASCVYMLKTDRNLGRLFPRVHPRDQGKHILARSEEAQKHRTDGASWFKGLSYPGGTDWSYSLLGDPKGQSVNTSPYTSPEGLLMMFQVASGLKEDMKGTQIQWREEKEILLIIQIVKKHPGLQEACRQESL